jgi:hypothetical protein
VSGPSLPLEGAMSSLADFQGDAPSLIMKGCLNFGHWWGSAKGTTARREIGLHQGLPQSSIENRRYKAELAKFCRDSKNRDRIYPEEPSDVYGRAVWLAGYRHRISLRLRAKGVRFFHPPH